MNACFLEWINLLAQFIIDAIVGIIERLGRVLISQPGAFQFLFQYVFSRLPVQNGRDKARDIGCVGVICTLRRSLIFALLRTEVRGAT